LSKFFTRFYFRSNAFNFLIASSYSAISFSSSATLTSPFFALDVTLFSILAFVLATASLFLVDGVFLGAFCLLIALALAFALRSFAFAIKSSQSYSSFSDGF
jgi:hypothetical protein